MRLRFLLVILILFLSIAYWAYDSVAESLDRRYREVVEELMVDQVNLLAAGLSQDWTVQSYAKAVKNSKTRIFEAKIYDLVKTHVGIVSYITNSQGVVLFHSEDNSLVGSDFSLWRDVHLTLNGQYGARSSRTNQNDDRSSVLYVAAPIFVDGQLQGVFSIGKPVKDWSTLLDSALWSMQKGTLIFVLMGVVFSFALSFWIFNPLARLNRFVKIEKLSHDTGGDEISKVASALSNMKEDLQAKKYVENYVQILTHELKSPISAIMGSAEILESNPSEEVHTKFTKNITSEVKRMQLLVETILKVSQLELSNEKVESESSMSQVIDMVNQAIEHATFEAGVNIKQESDWMSDSNENDEIGIRFLDKKWLIDATLISQAFINFLLNAIQYSPKGSEIIWKQSFNGGKLCGEIIDQGPGIPEYAIDKIFEKFYSLKKPRTGQKGTGLGLPFVREVFRLHGGLATVKNRSSGGVIVKYEIPLIER